eukprot:5627502-Prymnesium_polylepis.1
MATIVASICHEPATSATGMRATMSATTPAPKKKMSTAASSAEAAIAQPSEMSGARPAASSADFTSLTIASARSAGGRRSTSCVSSEKSRTW